MLAEARWFCLGTEVQLWDLQKWVAKWPSAGSCGLVVLGRIGKEVVTGSGTWVNRAASWQRWRAGRREWWGASRQSQMGEDGRNDRWCIDEREDAGFAAAANTLEHVVAVGAAQKL
jgi:hypothetical protein